MPFSYLFLPILIPHILFSYRLPCFNLIPPLPQAKQPFHNSPKGCLALSAITTIIPPHPLHPSVRPRFHLSCLLLFLHPFFHCLFIALMTAAVAPLKVSQFLCNSTAQYLRSQSVIFILAATRTWKVTHFSSWSEYSSVFPNTYKKLHF